MTIETATRDGYAIRQAGPADAAAIRDAHIDSIRSLGPRYYPPAIVTDWGAGLTVEVYAHAMAAGEVFFVATGEISGHPSVLGFSSDYCVEGSEHGTSVYVRGAVARRGIGSALLRRAEAHARARGATSIRIDASLAGVAFYRVHGFEEVGRGDTRLLSGRSIACVFMRKRLD